MHQRLHTHIMIDHFVICKDYAIKKNITMYYQYSDSCNAFATSLKRVHIEAFK